MKPCSQQLWHVYKLQQWIRWLVWWCASVCGGVEVWARGSRAAKEIFQFGLISVCDLGFNSAVIVCVKVFLAFTEIMMWRDLIGWRKTPALDPIYSQISFGCYGLSHLEQRSARVHNGNVNIWRGNIAVFETRILVLIFVGCYWVLWEYIPSLSHRGGPHVRGRENTPKLPNNFLSFARELGIQFNHFEWFF